jgi:VWFA-related protein
VHLTLRRVALILSVLLGGSLLAQDQQRPVFRGGVDLVTVDVIVLDKAGKPVTNLTAVDFTIVAGKRPRRVASAEFVPVKAAPAARRASGPGADAGVPAPTTNTIPLTGRTFFFAVDVEEIRAGEGRVAFRHISAYLDKLGPDDRVGLVSLPYFTPRVDLTTNRRVIKDTFGLIAGSSTRYRENDMLPGEAEGIYQGDPEALRAYFERRRLSFMTPSHQGTCGEPSNNPPNPNVPPTMPPECTRIADRTLDIYRRHTRQVLDSLGTLATAMAPIPGPKAIVLVSEGLLTDVQTHDDVVKFARACERAHVTLYSIHLDFPLIEGSAPGQSASSRLLDDHVGFDGMAEAAVAARGMAIRAIATPDAALQQIDTELSGYYLLSFASDSNDRDGQRERIEVTVNRPGFDVRARSEFTPGGPAGPAPKPSSALKDPKDLKAAMGELLKWPVPVSDIGLDVDAYATLGADSAEPGRALLAAEIADGGRPIRAVGYEIADDTAKVVADTFDAPPVLKRIDGKRSIYLVAVPLNAGRYRLKLGVLGEDGRRGSLEHAFEMPAWPATGLRISDLMLGDDAAGGFRPVAHVPSSAARLSVLLELRANSPDAFQGRNVELRLARAEGGEPLATQAVPLTETADPKRRLAAAALNVSRLPAGEYLVTIDVRGAEGESVRRERKFRKE